MKPWMIVSLVAAVLVVVFLIMRRDTPTVTNNVQVPGGTVESETTQEADQKEPVTAPVEQKVTYDGSSFTPNQLTVSKGTTVIFENKSMRPMWVASDPHPTHTGLSGFDSGRGYGEGENYSFTFNVPGNWGFHNHLNSDDTGKIIVN